MACFGFPNMNRCPRCGGTRSQRRSALRRPAAPAAAPPAAGANINELRACASGRPPANTTQELYTGPVTGETVNTCCDPYCGCREFPGSARSSFWPSFAHPRWLPCRELYNGANPNFRRR